MRFSSQARTTPLLSTVMPAAARTVISSARSQTLLGYLLALLLPYFAAWFTSRSHLVLELPGALLLVAVGLVASLWGKIPAILAILESTLLFNYILTPPYGDWSLTPPNLLRTAIFSAVASLIASTSIQRRAIEARLHRALAELHEQQEALMESQEAARTAAWIFNTKDRKTRWFRGGPGIFGRSYEEVTALGSPTLLIEAEDRPGIAAAAALTETTGAPFHVQFRVRWPNGELHWLESNGQPLASDPTTWRGVTMDITERKRAEAALVRSEKLAAAGRLASTIAHEINNPLEAITNLLYLAKGDIQMSPQARHFIEQAEHEIVRLAGISRLTLNFVRHSPNGQADPAAVLDSVLDLFQSRFLTRGFAVGRFYQPGTLVDIPADQLRQILTNLISNACDAANPFAESKRIDIHVRADAQSTTIEVMDDGAGIPAEILDRVFDPFFSTKDETGTGIGLWVTRELIQKYGGQISVRSGDLPTGHKTCFQITLPTAPAG